MEYLNKPRREFIREAALLSASLVIPWLEACNTGTDRMAATPDFLSHIQEAKILSEIGGAYVKAFPAEASVSELSRLLLGDAKGHTETGGLKDYFISRIAEDFQKGSVVIIKGWVLSVTEARQCALFHLSFNK